ncbi:MAG: class II glutamine amidotransferase, partial [Sulfitobacter sp.]|nr:class II glutamine amidotransferase [Sulfitobacter sp.]
METFARTPIPKNLASFRNDPARAAFTSKVRKFMCRVFAYIGPEIPIASLLLEPENSLINQSLDPELHPHLQLAGWGFGAWSEHLLKPGDPLLYHRPKAAFYDDNAMGIIPSLQGHTLLAHVRASGYDSSVVQTDENCHPFALAGTPWIIAQNGALPNWRLLQRELLHHCEDRFLAQMRGTTDTEFLFVL